MNKVNLTADDIIRLAVDTVQYKFYKGRKVNNAIKSQPLYQQRLRKAITDIAELIKRNNQLCEA